MGFRVGSVSHYTQFDGTGHQTMVGDARPWKDQLYEMISLQQNGAGVSRNINEATVDFTSAATYNATFTSADAVFGSVQLNHDRDHSVSIFPHLHWWQEKDYVPNWLIAYRWQVIGGVKTTAWTLLPVITKAFTYTPGTSLHQVCYSAAIAPPVGTSISDIVQFRIFRDTGNASGQFAGTDPYNTGGNATAMAMYFDPHIQINSLGSTDEYSK
jgi:hypothetical protein